MSTPLRIVPTELFDAIGAELDRRTTAAVLVLFAGFTVRRFAAGRDYAVRWLLTRLGLDESGRPVHGAPPTLVQRFRP